MGRAFMTLPYLPAHAETLTPHTQAVAAFTGTIIMFQPVWDRQKTYTTPVDLSFTPLGKRSSARVWTQLVDQPLEHVVEVSEWPETASLLQVLAF